MSHQRIVQYALMCLQELEQHGSDAVSSKEISDKQGVPLPECEDILERLTESGIVRSADEEGFVLARPIEELTALDILQAVWSAPIKAPAFKMLYQAERPGLRVTLKAVASPEIQG